MKKARKLVKMEEEIKVSKISKSEFRSEFNFLKEQQFFSICRKFLLNLGFEKDEWIESFGRPFNKEINEYILDKEENIGKYVDVSDHFSNKDYAINIIFGKDKIFLIINTKIDKQKEISNAFEGLIFEEVS